MGLKTHLLAILVFFLVSTVQMDGFRPWICEILGLRPEKKGKKKTIFSEIPLKELQQKKKPIRMEQRHPTPAARTCSATSFMEPGLLNVSFLDKLKRSGVLNISI